MLIEVGKKYKTRCGDIVEITEEDKKYMHPFFGCNGRTYLENGREYEAAETPNDLIEECQARGGIEVYGVYTAENGVKYKAIAIDGGKAYLVNYKSPGIAYRWNLDGSAVDLDRECGIAFKPAVPAWMANFDPGCSCIDAAFHWDQTPEGGDFWRDQLYEPTVEGMRRWVEMHAEYAKAKAEGLV